MINNEKEAAEQSQTNLLLILITTVISLVVLFLIASDSLTIGYIKEWSWGKINMSLDHLKIFYYFVITLLFLFFVYIFLSEKFKKYEWLFISISIIFFNIIILFVFSFNNEWQNFLSKIIAHTGATSYFNDAQKINNVGDFLRNYSQNVQYLQMHSQTHPPGVILLFYYLSNFAKNINVNVTYTIGLLIPFLSSLTIIPLYFLTKLFFNKLAAKISVVFYCLIPALILFTPQMDQVYALFFISIILFYYLGIIKKKIIYFILSGLFLAFGSYFSYLYTVIPLVMLILWILIYLNKKDSTKYFFQINNFFKYNIIFALAFLFPNIIYQIIYGTNIYEMYQASMVYHQQFLDSKSYLIWLAMNLFDFGIFMGLPITIVLLFVFGDSIMNFIKTKAVDISLGLFLLTIIILDLTGKNRSEVARLWLFLVPLMLISVAGYIANKKTYKIITIILALLLFLQIIVFRKYVLTIGL